MSIRGNDFGSCTFRIPLQRRITRSFSHATQKTRERESLNTSSSSVAKKRKHKEINIRDTLSSLGNLLTRLYALGNSTRDLDAILTRHNGRHRIILLPR